jgi:hypothetical protein
MTPAPTPLPFLGTWKLKSITPTSAIPIPMPHQSLVRFVKQADGIHYSADSTLATGQTMHADMIFQMDGEPHTLHGSFLGDAMSMKSLDSHHFEVTILRKGALSAKILSHVSADGKEMTGNWDILTPEGTATYTTVSERQPE